MTFPDTVQGVITSRIDRLPPQQQLTLKVASIIGRIFTVRLLNDIYPIRSETDQLRYDLNMLTVLDITRLDRVITIKANKGDAVERDAFL